MLCIFDAGSSAGNITIAAGGESIYDVSMADLSHVLLPTFGPAKPPKLNERTPKRLEKQRAVWLETKMQQAYCSLNPAGCEVTPLKHIADTFVKRDSTQDMQVHVHCWHLIMEKYSQTLMCFLCMSGSVSGAQVRYA